MKPFPCWSEALLRRQCIGSDGCGGVALSGSDPGHVLQLAGVRHVVTGLVLGQDFHQWTELQPPLLLRDPVPGETKDKDEIKLNQSTYNNNNNNKQHCIM